MFCIYICRGCSDREQQIYGWSFCQCIYIHLSSTDTQMWYTQKFTANSQDPKHTTTSWYAYPRFQPIGHCILGEDHASERKKNIGQWSKKKTFPWQEQPLLIQSIETAPTSATFDPNQQPSQKKLTHWHTAVASFQHRELWVSFS